MRSHALRDKRDLCLRADKDEFKIKTMSYGFERENTKQMLTQNKIDYLVAKHYIDGLDMRFTKIDGKQNNFLWFF